jgi:hypothetical protein
MIASATPNAEIASAESTETPFQTIAELVHKIHEGLIRPEDITMEERQRCVAYLFGEGLSTNEVCSLMRISERTARRDRLAARREAAIAPDAELGDELLGEFQQLTLGSIQRLIRLARDEKTPPYARMWIEEAMIRNYQRFIDTAARLQYFRHGTRRLNDRILMDPKRAQVEVEMVRRREEQSMRENLAEVEASNRVMFSGSDSPLPRRKR